jgi:hypothetical protein
MRVILFLLLLVLLSGPADAQTIWSRPYEPNQLAVEVLVPDAPDEATVLSGATFFTGTFSLNDNIEVSAELPVARYGAATNGTVSATAIGNPYLGFGFSSTTIPLLFQIGARFPAAPANAAASIGQISDAGRTAAFGPDEFVLSGLLNGRLSIGRQSSLRLRTGLGYASRARPETTSESRARDWRLYYDAQLWREGERLITGLSVTGRATLTSPGTTQHHAALSVMGNWDRVQPGVVTGTSLNTLAQDGEFAPFVGLTLSVSYLR